MSNLLHGHGGAGLPLKDYLADYKENFWKISDGAFWKLERQQHFQEPGFGSWEAFSDGDWDESLRRLEGERRGFEDYFARVKGHGFEFRRVRVVEKPVGPYLQWELHVLRLREECGERVRVVPGESVKELEEAGDLPELIILGPRVMYDIAYNDEGILAGATRYADTTLIRRCRELISELYGQGEELGRFFDREIAPLPHPARQRSA
jgi:hypothetical protein